MSKYIPIAKRSIHEQICHQEDLRFLQEINKLLPPEEQIQMELSLHSCAFGSVLIGSYQDQLLAVELGPDADSCYRTFINKWSKSGMQAEARTNNKIIDQVLSVVDTGKYDPNLKINLHVRGTWFQRQVWTAIQDIPYGSTMSYQELAVKINRTNSARSIGTACGANPIAIIIPCHRVIKSNGSQGEYHWGADLKKKLLDREQV